MRMITKLLLTIGLVIAISLFAPSSKAKGITKRIGSLPQGLVSFTVNPICPRAVRINWQTDDESNIISFEVQRRQDPWPWNLLATIDAYFTGQPQGTNYSFLDVNELVPGQTYQYRLGVDRPGLIRHFTDPVAVVIPRYSVGLCPP